MTADASTFIVGVKCKDCRGTGYNGSIGGYPAVCRVCRGDGIELVTYRGEQAQQP